VGTAEKNIGSARWSDRRRGDGGVGGGGGTASRPGGRRGPLNAGGGKPGRAIDAVVRVAGGIGGPAPDLTLAPAPVYGCGLAGTALFESRRPSARSGGAGRTRAGSIGLTCDPPRRRGRVTALLPGEGAESGLFTRPRAALIYEPSRKGSVATGSKVPPSRCAGRARATRLAAAPMGRPSSSRRTSRRWLRWGREPDVPPRPAGPIALPRRNARGKRKAGSSFWLAGLKFP